MTAGESLWGSSKPFEEQARPETKPRKKKGTEAELVLDETDAPEPELEDDEESFDEDDDAEIELDDDNDDDLEEFEEDDADDSDADDGEPIDGSEDDISDLERADALIASDVGSEPSAPAVQATVRAVLKTRPKKVITPMSEGKTTKADMIRAEIAATKAAGTDKPRPRDIIAALAKKGVTVTAPQVSVALRDYGKTTKTRTTAAAKPPRTAKTTTEEKSRAAGRLAATKPQRGATTAPAGVSADGPVTVAELKTVAAFLASFGSPTRARQAIDAYVDLYPSS